MRTAPFLILLLLLEPVLIAQVVISRENGTVRVTNTAAPEPEPVPSQPAPERRNSGIVPIEEPERSDPISPEAVQARRVRAYGSWAIFAGEGVAPFAVETSSAGPVALLFHDRGPRSLSIFLEDGVPTLVRPVNGIPTSGTTKQAEGVGPLPYELHLSLGADPKGWRNTVPVYRSIRFRDIFEGVDQVVTPGELTTVVEFHFDTSADPTTFYLSYPGLQSIDSDGSLLTNIGNEMAQPGPRFTYEDGAVETAASLEKAPNRIYPSIRLGSRRPLPLTMSFTMNNQGRVADAPFSEAHSEPRVRENGGAAASDGRGNIISVTSGVIQRQAPVTALDPGKVSDPLTIGTAVITKTRPGGQLEWVSILGGDGSYGSSRSRYAVAVDAMGRSFVSGPAFAGKNFPFTTAEKRGNTFVARISADGDLEASAATAAGEEGPGGIALAGDSGLACIASTVEPSKEAAVLKGAPRPGGATAGTADAYVACFDLMKEAKPLMFAGFIGGTGDDRAVGIAAGARGTLYVAGMTTSETFPGSARGAMKTLTGYRDGFVTLVDPARAGAASLVASTYFGRDDDPMGFYNESIGAIAVAPDGGVWIAGEAPSLAPVGDPIWEVRRGGVDIYLARLSQDLGKVERAIMFGSRSYDFLSSLAIDVLGNFYLAGVAEEADFPLVASAHAGEPGAEHFFATKINSAVTAIVWSTFVGSASRPHTTGERDLSVAVDPLGTIWIPVLGGAKRGRKPHPAWEIAGGAELIAVGSPSTAAAAPQIYAVAFDEPKKRWKVMGSGLAASDVLANGARVTTGVERFSDTIYVPDADGLRRIDVVNADGQSASAIVPERGVVAAAARVADAATGKSRFSLPVIGGIVLLLGALGFFVARR